MSTNWKTSVHERDKIFITNSSLEARIEELTAVNRDQDAGSKTRNSISLPIGTFAI